MIIYGWGHGTTKEYGPTMAIKCPNCDNDTWMHLYHQRKWFTLFFIPVIPYSSKHLLLCEVCSQGIALEKDQIQQAKQMNELTQALFNESISKDDYWKQADQIQIFA